MEGLVAQAASEVIRAGGSVGALFVLIIASGQLGLWVWRREFEALARDRDEWKQLALGAQAQLADTWKRASKRGEG